MAIVIKRPDATSRLWERLEVKPEDLLSHPKITPILIKSLGSIAEVIVYLRGSDAKEALELVRLWDLGTKKEHSIVPFEAYCLSAKTTPKKMIGIIMEAVTEQSQRATEMLVATAHPAIVQTTIKNAKTKKGFEDRETIHKNRGFLPVPKTQQFNNYGQISQDNRKQTANIGVGQLEEDNDKIGEAVDKFNANRVLNAGNMGEVDVIDVVDES